MIEVEVVVTDGKRSDRQVLMVKGGKVERGASHHGHSARAGGHFAICNVRSTTNSSAAQLRRPAVGWTIQCPNRRRSGCNP